MTSKPAIMQILVDAGARTDLCNETGDTALDVATQMNQSECVRILEPISMPNKPSPRATWQRYVAGSSVAGMSTSLVA